MESTDKLTPEDWERLDRGETVKRDGLAFAFERESRMVHVWREGTMDSWWCALGANEGPVPAAVVREVEDVAREFRATRRVLDRLTVA